MAKKHTILGQNKPKNIENWFTAIHGSNKIGNMSFEPKNIDISVKNMSKP